MLKSLCLFIGVIQSVTSLAIGVNQAVSATNQTVAANGNDMTWGNCERGGPDWRVTFTPDESGVLLTFDVSRFMHDVIYNYNVLRKSNPDRKASSPVPDDSWGFINTGYDLSFNMRKAGMTGMDFTMSMLYTTILCLEDWIQDQTRGFVPALSISVVTKQWALTIATGKLLLYLGPGASTMSIATL